jgi:hypothetical protein
LVVARRAHLALLVPTISGFDTVVHGLFRNTLAPRDRVASVLLVTLIARLAVPVVVTIAVALLQRDNVPISLGGVAV